MVRHLDFVLDKKRLDAIDKKKMHAVYDRWPKIAKEAYKLNPRSPPITYDDTINHIVFAGMGGSGAVGDVFAAILSKTPMHVTVTKGYELPRTVDKNTMVVATSVSGNTQETQAVLEAASKTSAKTVAFSSGGRIAEFCGSKNIRHTQIGQIHSPRASFASMMFTMLRAFEDVLPLHREDVTEAIKRLEKLQREISSSKLDDTGNGAQSLAFLIERIPLIYYPFGLQAAATRFKNSLQENAKKHAMTEDVVEACHNGIVAWERRSFVAPVMIEGSDDHPKTKERWKILYDYFDEQGIRYEIIYAEPGGILAKLVGLIYYGDYTSIYRAIYDGVDPSPIKSIRYVKSRLH